MKTIDVEDLPETVAQALAGVVRTLRHELRSTARHAEGRDKVELRVRAGKVIGRLTREEIYEDVA